jgi:hypothetical protein
MSNEFTYAQSALLTREAEREFFAPYYDEVDEDEVAGDDEYSWNKYTQTNECEDWDLQNGTWGYYTESEDDSDNY